MSSLADVAVPLPIPCPYTYRVPDELTGEIRRGQRVVVPFRSRTLTGYVVDIRDDENDGELKNLVSIVDDEPLLSDVLLQLADKIAKRYLCGPGEVLSALLPAGVKKGSRGRRTAIAFALQGAHEALADWPDGRRVEKQKAILKELVGDPVGVPKQILLRNVQCSESPLATLQRKGLVDIRYETLEEDIFGRLDIKPSVAPKLNEDQLMATGRIREALESGEHRALLLHGVTGSGKTEVYLDAIEVCLNSGRGAIVLVPEISLTPQTIERFESRFGCVAVLHSHLTDAERARQWEELRRGNKKIAIGPRSAIFAPIAQVGLIVLDEEHETTFKQQNSPRYQARDVALMRAELEGAVVVFGSATPSLESFQQTHTGTMERIVMPKRIADAPLPQVTLLDMRSQKPIGPSGLFSPLLANVVGRCLDRGEQVLLFLNRRGFNTSVLCRTCGCVVECRNCSIPLVYYRSSAELLCHYCGHRERPPERCPECRSGGMRFGGFGTETVEHAARTLFPKARIARMDGETMRRRHAHEDMFQRLKAGEVDILIGTQMIAKGLDFPRITLIGVISADTSLLIPDFRASERTFQLMTQVSGRAGRGSRSGHVFIQTYMPDHYSLEAASRHDYDAFAAQELEHRRRMGYPPFGSLLRIIGQGPDEKQVRDKMAKIAGILKPASTRLGATMLGPAPAPIEYLKRQWRHHLVVRTDSGHDIEEMLKDTQKLLRSDSRVQILLDRDPTSMM